MKTVSRCLPLLSVALLWLPLGMAQAHEPSDPAPEADRAERAEPRDEQARPGWREGELRGRDQTGKVRGAQPGSFEQRSALDGVVDGILAGGEDLRQDLRDR